MYNERRFAWKRPVSNGCRGRWRSRGGGGEGAGRVPTEREPKTAIFLFLRMSPGMIEAGKTGQRKGIKGRSSRGLKGREEAPETSRELSQPEPPNDDPRRFSEPVAANARRSLSHPPPSFSLLPPPPPPFLLLRLRLPSSALTCPYVSPPRGSCFPLSPELPTGPVTSRLVAYTSSDTSPHSFYPDRPVQSVTQISHLLGSMQARLYCEYNVRLLGLTRTRACAPGRTVRPSPKRPLRNCARCHFFKLFAPSHLASESASLN